MVSPTIEHFVVTRKQASGLAGVKYPNGLRNFELEEMLRKIVNINWVIRGWCPFDGVLCSYFELATISELERILEVYREGAKLGWVKVETIAALVDRIKFKKKGAEEWQEDE